jgi:hypothetical protein
MLVSKQQALAMGVGVAGEKLKESKREKEE